MKLWEEDKEHSDLCIGIEPSQFGPHSSTLTNVFSVLLCLFCHEYILFQFARFVLNDPLFSGSVVFLSYANCGFHCFSFYQRILVILWSSYHTWDHQMVQMPTVTAIQTICFRCLTHRHKPTLCSRCTRQWRSKWTIITTDINHIRQHYLRAIQEGQSLCKLTKTPGEQYTGRAAETMAYTHWSQWPCAPHTCFSLCPLAAPSQGHHLLVKVITFWSRSQTAATVSQLLLISCSDEPATPWAPHLSYLFFWFSGQSIFCQ